jgi:sigma-B regulation protein RsbU (phosphoserine phosphatase)
VSFTRDIPLDIASLAVAQEEIEGFLAAHRVALAGRQRVRLVVEELVLNLILHGRFAGPRQPARVAVAVAPDEILVTLDDAAAPFDPRGVRNAAPGTDKPGGRGLPLVRRMAGMRAYHRLPGGWNRTELAVARMARSRPAVIEASSNCNRGVSHRA